MRSRRLRPASLYAHARGSVLIPVNLFGLPEELELLGERWAVKEEFHVTAVHTPWAADRAGRSLDATWTEIAAALEGRHVGPVRLRDEVRRVRKEDERTLIVMAGVDGLSELYTELSGRLGAPLPAPPAHITLYTRPDGEGIGVRDETELRERTETLGPRDTRGVLDLLGI